MKKYLLTFIIIFISFFNNHNLFSTDWANYFPYPCEVRIDPDAPDRDTSWYGPYEYNFCLNSITDFENFCNDSSCCFKIIYYEYFHHHFKYFDSVDNMWKQRPDHFAVFVSGILITNGSNCNSCDSAKIAELFFRELVKCKLDSNSILYDPDFLNLDSLAEVNPPYPVWLISKGNCRKSSDFNEICSGICCKSIFDLYFDRNTFEYDSLVKIQNSMPIEDTCDNNPNQCVAYCNEIVFQQWLESCCDSIVVTPTIIDSTCCVNISVYNPYCYAPTPRIIFQQKNLQSGAFETEDSIICPYGQTVSHNLCPKNGNKFIIWRVKIDNKDSSGVPNCPPSNYVPNKTIYIGTTILSSCCDCDSSLLDSWLAVDVVKDDTCTNDGCLVSFHLNIDSNITCYNYFTVEDNHGLKYPAINVETELTLCLEKEEFGTFKVYLLQDSTDELDSACFIEKGIACDTIECCPSNHNDWLNVLVAKDPACPDSGCRVFMEWANRDSIRCYNYYMVEDINHNYLNTWGNGNIDSFPISSHSFCIGEGVSDTLWVHLYKHYEDYDSSCTIMKTVSCDSLAGPDSFPSPCVGNCLTEWTEEYKSYMFKNLCDSIYNCFLVIDFIYRTCPDSLQEFQIKSIYYGGDCSCLDDGEMIQKAIEALIINNPMGFYPTVNDTGCSYQWRVTINSCWRNSCELCYPCPSVCCYQNYKVCRYTLDSITIEPIGETVKEYEGTGSCLPYPEPPNIPEPKTCYDLCNYLYFSSLNSPGEQSIRQPINSVEDTKEFIKFTNNLFDGILNISVKSDCGNKIRVDIPDVYGIQWLSVEQLSISEKNNFKIDIHLLERGYYVYKIYCNGNYIGNGKFIVE
ncbi:MAG: hypothetical protein HZB41_09815 [Ignavibacteriae bacterium]|nr:hypothetical protein [Ignavibacteriota bacterium]